MTEPTAIHDDRFRGELLQVLLDQLQGTCLTFPHLPRNPRSFEIGAGKRSCIHRRDPPRALSSSEYRKARFLTHADDARTIHWALQFISEWDSACIQKQDHHRVLPIFEQ